MSIRIFFLFFFQTLFFSVIIKTKKIILSLYGICDYKNKISVKKSSSWNYKIN